MTPLRTRGMQITSDQAAAASEVPIMIYPGMIHTTTTPSHTLSVVFVFVHGFATAFYKHAHHHLRTSAQLSPQTNTLGFTLHNEKTVRFSGESLTNQGLGSTRKTVS